MVVLEKAGLYLEPFNWREINSVAVTVVMASQVAKMGETGVIAGVASGTN